MSYLVTEDCIRCKFQDCVEVCPVDCFHEGMNMLVIDAEECIDCSLCVPECEAEAIIEDCDDNGTQWADFNSKYTQLWPVITGMGAALVDAQEYMNVEGKLEKHFDPRPGNGG